MKLIKQLHQLLLEYRL